MIPAYRYYYSQNSMSLAVFFVWKTQFKALFLSKKKKMKSCNKKFEIKPSSSLESVPSKLSCKFVFFCNAYLPLWHN